MIAYETQLRYVIRDKYQSEKNILSEKNCQKKCLRILQITHPEKRELFQAFLKFFVGAYFFQYSMYFQL